MLTSWMRGGEGCECERCEENFRREAEDCRRVAELPLLCRSNHRVRS